MLLPEQEEFFKFFGVTPPTGLTAYGAKRFMEEHLKDPEKLARWERRPRATAASPTEPPPSAVAPVAPPASTPDAGPGEHRFAFAGSGNEYFGIWISNLLLTIVTLGIYSAWAKVRRLQYFYRHTEVAGATFDYHGDPVAILKGRLIAFTLLVVYNVAAKTPNLMTLAALLLLAIALPWLLRNSFRFRMRYSSWRGLRFRFTGDTPGAYAAFLWRPLVAVFTLYLAWPWAHQRLKRYQHGNASFGHAPFSFSASAGAFYETYLIFLVLAIAVMFVPFGMMIDAITHAAELARAAKEAGTPPPDPKAMSTKVFAAMMLMMLGSMLIAPLFQARMQNLVWNNTALGPHRFLCNASVWRLFGIHVTNFIFIVLTLGFYTPWAAVRVARFRVEAMTLVAADDLGGFVAEQQQELGAAGEETADLFDIDIAL
jgi:uncharacterized membrane protein YjgN (DUF898 family)